MELKFKVQNIGFLTQTKNFIGQDVEVKLAAKKPKKANKA